MGFLHKFKKIYFWVYLIWPIIKNFFPKIKVLSSIETLEKIRKTNCSCVRLGDGEFGILKGVGGPGYQKMSAHLRKALLEVLTNTDQNVLLCVPEPFDIEKMTTYTKRARYHWIAIICKFFPYLRQNLRQDYEYGNTQMTRPYIDQHEKSIAGQIFNDFKKIFFARDIVIVEGEKTRFGVGNDLLSGAKTIRRIEAPAKNAFEKYDLILQASNKIPKDALILVALGPAAKPLILDLSRKGYQALDVGHLDIEYEWFLRGVTKKIPIPGKYVNELKKGREVRDEINLSQYNAEIIERIE